MRKGTGTESGELDRVLVARSGVDGWSLRYRLLADARSNCAKQYEDLYATFVSLDKKAQTTAAIAGLQLAGILGVLQKGSLDALRAAFGIWAMYLTVGTVLLLAVVIGACVIAMKVREVPVPFRGEEDAQAILDLLELPPEEFGAETVQTHLGEYLKAWTKAIRGMASAADDKAKSVFLCQVLMLVGLFGTALSFFLLIVTVWA